MNIIGNRIMSDALFLEAKKPAVVGFFIKQVALTYLNLKPRLSTSDFLDATLVGEQYFTTLSSDLYNSDWAKLWSDYHEFNIKVMQHPGSSLDMQMKDIYGQDYEFTERVRKWLIAFLIGQKVLIFDRRSNLLKGIITELQRVGSAYNYQIRDTIVYSTLMSLDRYYDYFGSKYAAPGDLVDQEAVTKVIFPYIDAIEHISITEPLPYDEVAEVMWGLIRGWREFFICYLEQPHKTSEKTLELNKESKTKLSEILVKALQKELKP